jgi:hypothetical protein
VTKLVSRILRPRGRKRRIACARQSHRSPKACHCLSQDAAKENCLTILRLPQIKRPPSLRSSRKRKVKSHSWFLPQPFPIPGLSPASNARPLGCQRWASSEEDSCSQSPTTPITPSTLQRGKWNDCPHPYPFLGVNNFPDRL